MEKTIYLKPQGEDLRTPFVQTLLDIEQNNPGRLVFVVMDVGFSFLEPLKEKLGNRFKNFGVTEASSTIISAALAMEGFRPVFYSMINFCTLRVHEFIRNAICMHKAPVIIAGVKGSEKYKFLGFSHNISTDLYKPFIKKGEDCPWTMKDGRYLDEWGRSLWADGYNLALKNHVKDEDVKVLSHLPGMRIYLPQTPEETKRITKEAYEYNGPSYLRL